MKKLRMVTKHGFDRVIAVQENPVGISKRRLRTAMKYSARFGQDLSRKELML